MNKPETIAIDVPRHLLIEAFLEKMARPLFSPRAVPGDFLPAIGAEYEGGLYAGLTLHEGAAHALVLLPGEAEDIIWKDAVAWAEKPGGALPSRIDQLVLFKALPKEFEEAWYWSGEEYKKDSRYAWGQSFGDGDQGNFHKVNEIRCRAVRRVALTCKKEYGEQT